MFGNFIFSALAFLLALGLLISIHEFGHFWVARKMGVKVLKYSIGFGKSIWSRKGKVDGTEYAVAMIPLGGYVRMLDEREGNVDSSELHRAFNRQSVWARIAIVIAGPLANFLLAIVVYWLVMMTGISGIAPLLGDIDENTPAADAGLEFEDRIESIAGERVQTWSDARIALLRQSFDAGNPIEIVVTSSAGERQVRSLSLRDTNILQGEGDAIQKLGINQWWPKVDPIVGGLQPEGAAAQAGMMIGDRVLSVNGEPIGTWFDWVMLIRENAGETLELAIERNGEATSITLVPGERISNNRVIGFIGAWETQSQEVAQKARVVVSYPPVESLFKAIQRTWDMSVLTIRMLIKLIVGEASLNNISGPISIAQFAGQSASVGLDHYMNFLALISISLGVLNLLPIPLLDGGHLLYYFVEVVTRRPVSERIQLIGQQFGFVILGGLMLLAFYNDIWRLVG